MRVIAKRTLREFWHVHPDSQSALEEWYVTASKADWSNPNQVTDAIANSRYLRGDRFSFKIKGNHYRLLVEINFAFKIVYIRFIGTHADYDKINLSSI